jgi:hypothetical protein
MLRHAHSLISVSSAHEKRAQPGARANGPERPWLILNVRQDMSSFGLKRLVQDYLVSRPFKAGETVQLGWFIFRIADEARPPEVESLDFQRMASFTSDFSAAERIRSLQTEVLTRVGETAVGCTLAQTALVSRSYTPRRRDVFLERQEARGSNDSGWYVGVLEEKRDLENEGSFELRSLYELSIADERMVPFWLLPVGKKVMLSTGDVL